MTYVTARLMEGDNAKRLVRNAYNSFGRYLREIIPLGDSEIHLYDVEGDALIINPANWKKPLMLITNESTDLEGIEKKIKNISSKTGHRFVIELIK